MVTVIVIQILGVIVGVVLTRRKRLLAFLDRVSGYIVYVLLLLLGISVGSNKKVIESSIPILGKSFVLVIFIILGSLVVAYLGGKLIWKKDKK